MSIDHILLSEAEGLELSHPVSRLTGFQDRADKPISVDASINETRKLERVLPPFRV